MNIDEAIQVNKEEAEEEEKLGNTLGAEAIRLGIEALKRVKSERQQGSFSDRSNLPGETEQ